MLIAVLVAVALQEPVASPSPAPAAPQAQPAPPTKPRSGAGETVARVPPTRGERKSVKGTLGGIDVDAKTVRFVDESGKTIVWPVDERLAADSPIRAAELLKQLQPGDPVTIVYHEDDGQPTVTEIRRTRAGARPKDQPER